MSVEKKYTIEEIKEYLTGNIILFNPALTDENGDMIANMSLKNAIHEIDDPEDGIEAVLERLRKYKQEKINS